MQVGWHAPAGSEYDASAESVSLTTAAAAAAGLVEMPIGTGL